MKEPQVVFFHPHPRKTASQKYFYLSTKESVFVEIDLFLVINRRLDFLFLFASQFLQFFISYEDFILVEALLHMLLRLFVFSCLAHTAHRSQCLPLLPSIFIHQRDVFMKVMNATSAKLTPYSPQTGNAQMFSHTYRELVSLRLVDYSKRDSSLGACLVA